MIVDESKNQVRLLSPFGSLYTYDLEGNFIKQNQLPEKSNYQAMEQIGDNIMTWTIPVSSDEPCITIVNADNGKEVSSLWKGPRILNSLSGGSFYTYDGKTYFAPAQTIKHLFYRKSDGKSFFFKDTQENISIRPQAYEEECIVQFASYDDLEAYKSILSPAEYQKIISRNEEDNPCLIKLYFK